MELFYLHIAPSLLTSLLFLILISGVIFILKIKTPAFRAILLLLLLIKSLKSLISGSPVFETKAGAVGFKLIDPLNFIPTEYSILDFLNKQKSLSILLIASLIGMAIAIIAISIRWLAIYLFYKELANDEVIEYKDRKKILKTINKLSSTLRIKAPRLILTQSTRLAMPAAVGFRKTALILSPNLINTLPFKDTEVIIAHELAHLKRKDNLWHWLAMASRDLMFFNPLAQFAYYLVKKNQERAANQLIIKKLGIKPQVLAKTVKDVSKYFTKSSSPPLPPIEIPIINRLSIKSSLAKKEIVWILNTSQANFPHLTEKILFSFSFIFLIWLEFVFVFPIK